MSTEDILAWTLIEECPIPSDVTEILTDGEQAICAYKTFRDSAIFTTKRLIVRDAQGLTGKRWRFIHCLIVASICGRARMQVAFLISTLRLSCGRVWVRLR